MNYNCRNARTVRRKYLKRLCPYILAIAAEISKNVMFVNSCMMLIIRKNMKKNNTKNKNVSTVHTPS